MYYELTRKEYKKYNKEFRNTCIGRNYRITYLSYYIVAIIMLIETFVSSICENSYTLELGDLAFILIMASFIICGTNIWLKYESELKEYILKQKK